MCHKSTDKTIRIVTVNRNAYNKLYINNRKPGTYILHLDDLGGFGSV